MGPSVLMDQRCRIIAQSGPASVLTGDVGSHLLLERLAHDVLIEAQPHQRDMTVPGTPARRFVVRAVPLHAADGQPLVWLTATETTIQDHLIEALKASRQMFKDLADAAGEISLQIDAEGRIAYARPPGVLGFSQWELNQQPITILGEAASLLLHRERQGPIDLWLTARDGSRRCVSLVSVPAMTGQTFTGVRIVGRDVTADRAAAAALADFERREALSLAVLAAGREETTPEKMLDRALAAVRDELHAARVTLARMDRALSVGLPETGQQPVAADVAARGEHLGQLHVAWLEPGQAAPQAMVDLAAEALALVVLQADHLDALGRLSLTDDLTGLANRRAFEADVIRRLSTLSRSRAPGVLLLIDIDHFKTLNDRCGHAAGDAALKTLADIMRQRARAGDLPARIGGDEFALWLDGTDAAGAERVATALNQALALATPTLGDGSVTLSLSIGGVVADPLLDDLSLLFTRADEALYAVKRAGRNGFRLWSTP
jgi:diguanylate cyclase (GGDEF)-like protein